MLLMLQKLPQFRISELEAILKIGALEGRCYQNQSGDGHQNSVFRGFWFRGSQH